MHTRKYLLGAAVVATLVGGPALAAQADAAPQTTTVMWAVPGGFDSRFSPAQTLWTGTVGECGQPDLQIDLYKYATPEQQAIVDDLVDGGVLTGSDKDSAVWISNQDVPATAPCPVETPAPSPTPTPTEAPTPTPTASPTTPAPIKSEAPSPAPTEAKPTSTPPAPVTPSGTATQAVTTVTDQAPTPTAEALAFTGSKDMRPFGALAAGLLLVGGLLARLGVLVVRRRSN